MTKIVLVFGIFFIAAPALAAGYISPPEPWAQVALSNITCQVDSNFSEQGLYTFSVYSGNLQVHATRGLTAIEAFQKDNACRKSLVVVRNIRLGFVNIVSGLIAADENFLQVAVSQKSLSTQAQALRCEYGATGFSIGKSNDLVLSEPKRYFFDSSFEKYLHCNAALAQAQATGEQNVLLLNKGKVAPTKGFFQRHILK